MLPVALATALIKEVAIDYIATKIQEKMASKLSQSDTVNQQMKTKASQEKTASASESQSSSKQKMTASTAGGLLKEASTALQSKVDAKEKKDSLIQQKTQSAMSRPTFTPK